MTISIIVYTCLLAVYLFVLFRTPDRDPSPGDKEIEGEDRFLRLAVSLNLLWLFSLSLPFYTPPLQQLWIELDEKLFAMIGVGVFVLGSVVRATAIRTLDRHFTYKLTIRQDHTLIQHGLYRWIRHPSYTGTLLEVTGMMLAARSWIGMLLFIASAGTIIGIRIRREERMLTEHFGQEYKEYMKRTWRLFPGLF